MLDVQGRLALSHARLELQKVFGPDSPGVARHGPSAIRSAESAHKSVMDQKLLLQRDLGYKRFGFSSRISQTKEILELPRPGVARRGWAHTAVTQAPVKSLKTPIR
jgi:hypothetical protein